jgi:predicted acylesterase/phospholipase RssA
VRAAANPHERALNGMRSGFSGTIWIAIAFGLVQLGACGSFGCRGCTRVNDPLPEIGEASCTRATLDSLLPEQLPKQVFVGIAMSGGGSRAANFSAAALLELQAMGILPNAALISSVSGSSLVNAYYGRYGDSPDYWNAPELRRRMGSNLQSQWEMRWLWPQNALRYWFTDYDRSDIMKEVFDDALFDGTHATFADMNGKPCDANPSSRQVQLPAIVINATTLSGQNFVFTDEVFKKRLKSRLDTFSLSHAIMASAAFPGVFQNVTLQDYRQPKRYQHLFDGGPSDNLGIEALESAIHALDAKTLKGHAAVEGCLLVLIDSFTNDARRRDVEASQNSDPRKFLDFLVDDNFSNAIDAMLSHRREDSLEALAYPYELFDDENKNASIGRRAYWTYRPLHNMPESANPELVCHVWHLTFQRLDNLKSSVPETLSATLNKIKTQFRLGGFLGHNHDEYQNALYQAARILVSEDIEARDKVLATIRRWALIQ